MQPLFRVPLYFLCEKSACFAGGIIKESAGRKSQQKDYGKNFCSKKKGKGIKYIVKAKN